MVAPNYNRNGNMYVPGVTVGVSGLVGGSVLDAYANFNITNPSTGAAIRDLVVIPALTLDAAGQYLYVWAQITVVNNANTKTVSLNWGGTGAIGSAPTGGTTLATVSGTTITNMLIMAWVMKTAANAQNLSAMTVSSATVALSNTTATATDTGNIQLNLVLNPVTTASDISGVTWGVQFCA